MITSRSGLVGLLMTTAAAVAGCAAAADAEPDPHRADVAVPSYIATAGTPDYCALLAGSRHLTRVPSAVGILVGERGNVAAELDLIAATSELRTVLEQVRDAGEPQALETAIDDLVVALTTAQDSSVTTTVRDDISDGLDDVGRLAQPACGFPT